MKRKSSVFTILASTFVLFVGSQGDVQSRQGASLPEVTNSEIKQLTEEIFNIELNSDFQNHVSVNLQGREKNRRYRDLAPRPLLTLDDVARESHSLKCVSKLFDNYESNTLDAEIVTPEEIVEQENFLDHLLASDAIYRVMSFLSDRGFIEAGNQTYRSTLNDLWFSQFARQKRSSVPGSSAFEHVFVGESKSGGKLIGLHAWTYFYENEKAGRIDYWGYRTSKNLGNSTASLANVVFTNSGKLKSSTIFIGTSPALEISVYTLCYFTRPDKYCRVSMGGTKFGIQTWVVNHGGNKPTLGTAFPIVQ